MSSPSASWERTLERVKELLTLNKVYLHLLLPRSMEPGERQAKQIESDSRVED